MTTDRLAEIRAQNEPQQPGPCIRCGAELVIGSMHAGLISWSCPNVRTFPGVGGLDHHHYHASLTTTRQPSQAVADLLAEVDRLRAALLETA